MTAIRTIFSKNRLAAALFCLICIAVSVTGFVASVSKPFSLDETDLATRAHMINSDGPRGPELFFGKNNGEAVPHPPMYDYTLALIFHVFGETETSARFFGILCFIAVGILTALSLKFLLEEETAFVRDSAIFIALCFYLVNPLILQHSMLVDADAAYTFLFLNLFIYFFIRFEKCRPESVLAPRLALASVFALVCLSKEGTPFLLAGGVLAYRALGSEWKKLFLDLLLVFALGAAIAWSAWLVFCHYTGIDVMIFLRQQYAFRVSKFGHHNFLMKIIKDLPATCQWPLLWMSPGFFALLGMALFHRAASLFSVRRRALSDVLLLAGGAVWLPYLVVRPSMDMMKYQHPVYPLFMMSITCYLAGVFRRHESAAREQASAKPWALLSLIFIAGLGVFYYHHLGDPVYFLAYPAHDGRKIAVMAMYWRPVLLIFSAAAIYGFFRRRFFLEATAVACLVFIFSANVALDLRQTAPYTTAESWLNYGESGLKETAEYLSVKISPKTPCILRKDLVYYLQFRYGITPKNTDPVYLFKDGPLPEAVRNFLRGTPADYVELDPVVMMSNPYLGLLGKKVFQGYTMDKKIGSFMILKKPGWSL